ncbi:acyl-CoA dehydrogenase family protein [Nocardioides sp. Bht2]|uniref:acyl-CoA dehydrogenase family protein n=1 Tax=Nocardioides sp. Bht2 TaxID=3392297 RepID=UPI0039B38EE1
MSEFDTQIRSLVAEVVRDTRESTGAGTGFETDLWRHLQELALVRIGIEESQGGSGGCLADLVNVTAALGQAGVSVPFIEVAVADWIRATAGPLGEPGLCTLALDADLELDGAVVSGTLNRVPWARHAEAVVALGVDGQPFVVELTPATSRIEQSENLAEEACDTIVLSGAYVTPLPADAPRRAEIVARHALLQAAALIGACHGAFAMTKEHVRTREQFGKPLIALPAVTRHIALMRIYLVQAEAALERAEAQVSAGVAESGDAVAVARTLAAQVGTLVARTAHQLHGAIGTTAEFGLHRYSTRLWAWRDSGRSEATWTQELGRRALESGEEGLWESLTAATPVA